jgi:CRISPR-associated protein Csh2
MSMTTEYVMFWDATMSNPNGDMLNDNKPRHDEITGQLEVSDVRIKRYIRDDLAANGHNVLVQNMTDENGKVLTCEKRVDGIAAGIGKKVTTPELKKHLLENYIDVRLFGAVIAKKGASFDIMGPLQIAWSKSIHEAEIKTAQGNSAYASGEGMEQATIWTKHMTPYALFRTYAIFNSKAAEKQGITVSDGDLVSFREAFIQGFISYRSTSKFQMPRMLVEVTYKEHMMDGDLDYVDAKYDCGDLELRNIDQVTFDVGKLKAFYGAYKDHIENITIYKRMNVKIDNVPSEINVVIV